MRSREGSRGVESHSSPPQWSGGELAGDCSPRPNSSSRRSLFAAARVPVHARALAAILTPVGAGPLHRLRGLHALLELLGPASLPPSHRSLSSPPSGLRPPVLLHIVIIIVLNLIFGVIIDTFADLLPSEAEEGRDSQDRASSAVRLGSRQETWPSAASVLPFLGPVAPGSPAGPARLGDCSLIPELGRTEPCPSAGVRGNREGPRNPSFKFWVSDEASLAFPTPASPSSPGLCG